MRRADQSTENCHVQTLRLAMHEKNIDLSHFFEPKNFPMNNPQKCFMTTICLHFVP